MCFSLFQRRFTQQFCITTYNLFTKYNLKYPTKYCYITYNISVGSCYTISLGSFCISSSRVSYMQHELCYQHFQHDFLSFPSIHHFLESIMALLSSNTMNFEYVCVIQTTTRLSFLNKKKKAIFSVYMYGILSWLWLNSDGHNIIVYLGFKVSFLQVL